MIVTETLAVIVGMRGTCCALIFWGDEVVDASSAVRYMRGWSRVKVRDYCAKHGWKARVIYAMECERRNSGMGDGTGNDTNTTYPQTAAA